MGLNAFIPVSYTHLDVYKRQFIYGPFDPDIVRKLASVVHGNRLEYLREAGAPFPVSYTHLNYENLGIGRLIYQLPTILCQMFLQEVFKKNPIDALDQETLLTINKFFENNLNVSETARKLFVHRNTLVYRLEKIKKLTGLDLREFDDAITFKVALMVKKYLISRGIES